MKKNNIQNLLNSFTGDYREIYTEQSKFFRLFILNGKVKTPSIGEMKGGSLLARIGKKEYFKTISGNTEKLDGEVNNFINKFDIKNNDNLSDILLNGKDEINFCTKDTIFDDGKSIIKDITKIYEEFIEGNKIIKSSEISINLSNKNFIIANSKGVFDTDSLYYNTIFVRLLGEKNGISEEVYEKITGIEILDTINYESIKEVIKKALKTLNEGLEGINAPNGEMDVIIGNESGGTIIHEAVGHGLEADLQNSSAYKGQIGKKVAGENVTIIDNPTTENERGFYNIDHEGVEAKNTVLIENGILKTYLHNNKTADNMGVKTTAHGRKENYKYKSLVRMGNTYLAPGSDKKEELIKKVKSGIYVSAMGGGQVNTTTGDFVFKIQNGFLIEDGKLSKNIRGATISGNGPKMLHNIYGICDDLNFFDGGTCGKGQAMPVSDGNPTFLTKLKVSGV